ncbi:thioredoxin domain-containing protein [Streptomyces sp. NPDC127084]|uniref:DsbA family protein n=1 Tax=Streptomyces sp. NPDC127084 TaxID=3347133 RepID=UPI0036696C74
MSEKNPDGPDGRRAARERLVRGRELDKAREKRRRLLIVCAAVVCVLGLAAVIGVIAANAGRKDSQSTKETTAPPTGPVAAPSGATGGNQPAITVGKADAPSTLTVWEDFRCPVCAQFETTMRDAIHELVDSGQLKADYHFATIIDGNLGGTGSVRAANAAACAQDAGKFVEYHDLLFENQPSEAQDAFGDNAELIQLSAQVEGLDTPAFRGCVEKGTYDAWVNRSAEAFHTAGHRGTPTVLLNGEPIFPAKGGEPLTPDSLRTWVAEANKGRQPGTASAPPSTPGTS